MFGIELRVLCILSKLSATGHIFSVAKDGSLSVITLAYPHPWQAHTHRLPSPFTRVCLSVGEDRASTRSLGQILSSFSCSTCQYQRYPDQSNSEPLFSEILLQLPRVLELHSPRGTRSPWPLGRWNSQYGFTDGDHAGPFCFSLPSSYLGASPYFLAHYRRRPAGSGASKELLGS